MVSTCSVHRLKVILLLGDVGDVDHKNKEATGQWGTGQGSRGIRNSADKDWAKLAEYEHNGECAEVT